jgi:hypothetical protein
MTGLGEMLNANNHAANEAAFHCSQEYLPTVSSASSPVPSFLKG